MHVESIAWDKLHTFYRSTKRRVQDIVDIWVRAFGSDS